MEGGKENEAACFKVEEESNQGDKDRTPPKVVRTDELRRNQILDSTDATVLRESHSMDIHGADVNQNDPRAVNVNVNSADKTAVDAERACGLESHDAQSADSGGITGYTSFRDLLLEPLLPASASDQHLRHPSQIPEHFSDSIQEQNDGFFMYNTTSDSVSVIMHNISPKRLRQCAWLLALLNVVALILAIPVLTLLAIRAQEEEHDDPSIDEGQITLNTLFFSASLFVLLACSLTVLQVFGHLTHWYQPDLQNLVIRILFMVPVYSLSSWICLRLYSWTAAVTFFRGTYEAFVLYSFYAYIVELLGGKDHMIQMLEVKDPCYGVHCQCLLKHAQSTSDHDDQTQRSNTTAKNGNIMEEPSSHQRCRFCCQKSCLQFIKRWMLPRQWTMGEDFYKQTRRGILQFVALKIVYTVGVVYIVLRGGFKSFAIGWVGRTMIILLSVMMNLSVGRALYCLLKVFHATKKDLRRPINYHPTWKFGCVKGVIFFTFWQDVILHVFNILGWIPSWGLNVSSGQVTAALQNYIVCLELLLFSVAHHYSFPYKEYRSLFSPSVASSARSNERLSGEIVAETNSNMERRTHVANKESKRKHGVETSSSPEHHRDTSFIDPPSALFSFATHLDNYSPETTLPSGRNRIAPRSLNPFDSDVTFGD